MAIESATYLADLAPANPLSTDPVADGDDHIRLIKQVLQNTFPSLSGPVPLEKYSAVSANQTPGLTDGGTTYVCDAASANITIQIPDSSSVAITAGYTLAAFRKDSSATHTVVFSPQGSDVVKGAGSLTLNYPFEFIKLVYLGSHVWRVIGTSRIGEVSPFLGSIAPAGTVFLNGDTMGNAGATATHANADCEGLYHLLWRSMADTEAPITGGRGASAAADWAANKAVTLPDMRGRAPIGRDTMGAMGAASRVTAGNNFDASVLGKAGGTETHTLITSEIPSHNHTVTDPGHTHTYSKESSSNVISQAGSIQVSNFTSFASIASGSNTTGITLAAAGGGGAHTNLQPSIAMNYIIRMY